MLGGTRKRALLLVLAVACLHSARAQTCETVSQVRSVTLTAVDGDGDGFSHAVANVASTDMLFAREPTSADVRRAPFVHAGAGRVAGISAEPLTHPGQLPDLVLQRGVEHELLWPRDGACVLVGKPAAFSLVDITKFFTKDPSAKATRALVPANYAGASLQYGCQGAGLGLLAGTIHVATAATARLLSTFTTVPDAVKLRAPLETATAYAHALELRVQPGYMGPEGAGFVQRLGSGSAWPAGTALRVSVVAGSTLAQPAQGAHMALVLARAELRSAADWQNIVCGSPVAGQHAAYSVCRDAQGVPTNAHVVDAAVVPLWRRDACSLLRARVQVQSTSSAGLVAAPAADAAGTHGALWTVPALADTRRLCAPGAALDAQAFPCRWPDGLASPFPVQPGPAGPFFFDRVLVRERGWILVCVAANGDFAHADALRAAPNAPANPYVFTAAQFVFGGPAPGARVCPGGHDYTHEGGAVTWVPSGVADAAASAQLWVYAIFTLGDSDACKTHACNAAAVGADAPAYLSVQRETRSLLLFESTTFDVRAPAPSSSGTRRRAPVVRAAEGRAGITARRRALAHESWQPQPQPRPARALLAVDAPDASGAIITQDVTAVEPARMLEHSVCQEYNRKHCVAVRADVQVGSVADYCQPESELIGVLRLRLAKIALNMQVVVVGVHRPDYDAVCATGAQKRRLLSIPTVNAKIVVAADGMIERIVFLEGELTQAQASGVRVESGASAASIVTVAHNTDEFLLGKGAPIVVARDGTSGWSASVYVAVFAGSTAGLAILAIALRYCALYRSSKYAVVLQLPDKPPAGPCPQNAPLYTNTIPYGQSNTQPTPTPVVPHAPPFPMMPYLNWPSPLQRPFVQAPHSFVQSQLVHVNPPQFIGQ